MEKFYSHHLEKKGNSSAGKLLEDHIKECLENAKFLVEYFVKEEKWRDFYFQIIKLVCIFHDLGKILPFIQEAIKFNKEIGQPHAPIGYLLFESYWEAFEEKKNDEKRYIASYIIRKHHSNFNWNFTENYDEDKIEEIENEIENCKIILSKIEKNVDFLKKLEEMLERKIEINKWKQEVEKIIVKLKKIQSPQVLNPLRVNNVSFIDILMMSSIFFLADRFSASSIKAQEFINNHLKELFEKKTYEELFNKFINYYSEKYGKNIEGEKEINKLRYEAHRKVIEEAKEEFRKNSRVIKINLPTGLGKTFIGCRLALKIAKEEGLPVIYSLPFINLIEQVENRLSSIFGSEKVGKFHHLVFSEDEEKQIEREFVNFFFYPITITTFVQVFNSIFTSQRSMFIKLPILVNSVWIVDELQNIPPHLYKIIEETIKKLSERGYKIKIILMSATLPVLFPEKEVYPRNRKDFFEKLNRYELTYYENEKDLEDYVELILKEIDTTSKERKKVAIITNRVEEAIYVFKKIKEHFQCNEPVYYKDIEMEEIKQEIIQIENYLKHLENLENIPQVFHEFVEKIKIYIENVKKSSRSTQPIFLQNKKDGIGIMYLAANLTSLDKLLRSHLLKKEILTKLINKLNWKIFILVSTQTIEAGIDVDLDLIYRDIAPLDSLVQSAGRVNRENTLKEKGKIKVYTVKIRNEPTYKRVYDKFLIDHTQSTLGKKPSFEEKEIFNLVESFFKDIKTPENYENYKSVVENLKFKEMNKKLTPIEPSIFRTELVLDNNQLYETISKVKEFLKNLKKSDIQKYKELSIKWFKQFYPLLDFLIAEKSLEKEEREYIEALINREEIKFEEKTKSLFSNENISIPPLFVRENYYCYYGFSFKFDRLL